MADTTFSKEEKAAMRAAVAEEKARKENADLEAACLAAIADMIGLDKALATKFHELVVKNTSLHPKTWYGMPAYADDEGKTVVAFKNASKFKLRYASIEFQTPAKLDDGKLWPVGFAVTGLSGKDGDAVAALLKKAVR
jgi:uncharacterized protein YdhG (YjbR/CyaY superfamily)